MAKGLIIVISAPSGAGKTTICGELVKKLKNVTVSVSVTTRDKRPGDVEGRDYFFISDKKFREMARENRFVEWAKVHNHYYGTPRKFLQESIEKGKDVILEIDVQGGKKIKKAYPDGVFIFILPPSLEALSQRLSGRAKDSQETINLRIRNARKEISYITDYTYLVINDNLQEAVSQTGAIIESERRKINRLQEEINKFRV